MDACALLGKSRSWPLLELDTGGGSSGRPPLIRVLTAVLERVVATNDSVLAGFSGRIAGSTCRMTIFHGQRAPTICVGEYIDRVFKYANCSVSCLVVACIYLDRLMTQHSELLVNSLNVHRLLSTCVMAAAKFFDDSYHDNSYFAKIGGVSCTEMNRLELEFLFRLDFRLNVTPSTFTSYCTYLENERQLALPFLEHPPQLMLSAGHGAGLQNQKPVESSGDSATSSLADTLPVVFGVHTPPRDFENHQPGVCSQDMLPVHISSLVADAAYSEAQSVVYSNCSVLEGRSHAT